MKRTLGLGLILAAFAAGCLPTASVEEGGANANDRTAGGEPGEVLLTGVMEISPDGRFAIMQRNTVTVLLDVEKGSFVELPQQLQRAAFSKTRDVAYALMPDSRVVALDLATATELWSVAPFGDVSLFKVNDDDTALVVVDGSVANVIDPEKGVVRASPELPTPASFGAFLPGSHRMAIAGHTSWSAHVPATPVALVDLDAAAVVSVDVPNCEAPLTVLPDASRILMSPTFCEEDRASNPDDTWTNPDPVSVIDVSESGLSFLKNLPGFGPVALTPDGSRAVAYLDTARVDASMFDDESLVPSKSGPEYHLMVIDPKSLAYSVTPIGDALPRFALSRDGKGLLVDASVKIQTRTEVKADANLSLDTHGITVGADVHAKVFDEESPFGYFDIGTLKFTAFKGPQAGLDRFVQLADGKTVLTLEKRADGLGGIPYLIDLEAKTTVALTGDYGTGVRDVGLLPDGSTMLLRFREAAAQVGNSLFARETYCLSLDGVTCASGRIEYQASVAFATADSNDCANMGHDCW
jgi:hypothetical protein